MAGELITADFQLEWAGTLLGAGTVYRIDRDAGGVSGLGVPTAKTADVDLSHKDGSYASHDYRSARVLSIPFVIAETPATAGSSFRTLSGLWAPRSTDAELHLRLPGFGRIKVNGRPRGLLEDLSMLHAGVIRVLATFWCGDPTITYIP